MASNDQMSSGAALAAFYARGVTPAPHEGLHHQISNAFIRFVVEPKATPGTNYRARTKWPSGAALAGIFRKGRDASSFRSGCIHGTSCGAAPYASHEFIQLVTASHLTSNIINHQPTTFHAFPLLFSHFSCHYYPHFMSKMGPFNPLKYLRVPYLHHSPRLPYFFIITDNLHS